jgi:hypothetical protein
MIRPLAIAVLVAAAGCASPEGSTDRSDPPLRAVPAESGEAPGATAPGPASAEQAATGSPGVGDDRSPSAEAPASLPPWWSEQPVRQGQTVSVCAEATAPTLRQARQQAIQMAYTRLEEELAGGAVSTAAIEDYEVSEVAGGAGFRFRVRVVGSDER